jgi:hypothetical protein
LRGGEALIDRFPDGGEGERLHHAYLFFESNFNGTWDQYIDAFSEVVAFRMKAIYSWATSATARPRAGRAASAPLTSTCW